ncbi:hypothetical protein GWK47_033611 [Chionoecetes opilio]|uniref:Uncharacterized protein n=1 Tax=Chionoecetes opilio TaxID=41210 RepID=A0A8J5D132_CHIOP|nr:hypothetical protein GWK47_033611 [Chionoecetes opilio]
MASKVEEPIRHWKFEDRVGGLCFDTTASNTGVHAGCCTLLEQKLGRPLLNLACRHHVMELILASAFKAPSATLSSRPRRQLFKRFPKEMAHSHKNQCYDHQRPRLAGHDEWKRTTLEALAKAAATTRDDYKELAELTAKAIKGEVFPPPSANQELTTTRDGGGEGDLKRQDDDVQERVRTTPRELRSLQEMSVFIILIYARAWSRLPLGPRRSFQRSHSLP